MIESFDPSRAGSGMIVANYGGCYESLRMWNGVPDSRSKCN